MSEPNAAVSLIAAAKKNGISEFVDSHFGGDSISAAYSLKDYCYGNWTAKPTTARDAAAALSSLAILNPQPETVAVAHWIRGISDITEGRLESAVQNLDRARAGFLEIGKKDEAAQTQVAALIPLGLLGDYERAVAVGLDAHKVLSDLGQTVAAGKIELNLSNIAARQGRFVSAKQYGESAVKTFSNADEKSWLVMAENDLANTLSELNEFDEAEILYERALKIARSEKMNLTEAELLASRGNLKTYRGQYGEAIRYLEQSRSIFESLNMPHQTAIANLEIAEIYQILNLIPESYELYKQTIDSLHDFKLRGEAARAHANMGRLASLNGESAAATSHLEKAASLYKQEENLAGAIGVNLIRARHMNSEGQVEQAFELLKSLVSEAAGNDYLRHELEASSLLGETLRLKGLYEDSTDVLTRSIDRAVASDQLQIAIPAYVTLAGNAISTEDFDTGEANLLQAVELIESLRAPIPAEEFRMSYLADKIAPYEILYSEYVRRGRIQEAFTTTERSRARTLLEKLESESQRKPAGNSDYEALREQLNWNYSKLQRGGAGDPELNAKISEIEKLLSQQKLRDSSTAPGVTAPETNWPEFTKVLQTEIGTDRMIISYTVVDGNISAFLLDGDELQHFGEIGAEEELIRLLEGLKFQFESIRFGSSLEKFQNQLNKRTNLYLERLYELLILPFEEYIAGKRLVIIPARSLFYVPFNALFDGDGYLIENHEIVLAPSAAIWSKLQTSPRDFETGFAAAIADDSIPRVEEEIKNIGTLFPDTITASGAEATLAKYFEHSKSSDFIHLACHGEFRPDNPMYSNLRFADGFLNVRDISAQNLNAVLVTLSACETGLSKVYPGEEVLGLVRGFLGAGTQNIVMSLWTVSDEASLGLMTSFYTSLSKGTGIAKSLQNSQKAAIEIEAHPYFWAPFAIIGA